MKKIWKTVTAIAVAATMLTSAMGLASCGLFGKDDENDADTANNFVGAVSEKSYESAEEAAKAFLQTEICGEDEGVEFVSYKSEKQLTASEIEELKLGDSANGLTKAEKGTVEYREASGVEATAATEEKSLTRSLYLLIYPDSFRYFAPPVQVGETLTASYLNFLSSPDKYANCTIDIYSVYSEGMQDGLETNAGVGVVYEVTEKVVATYEYDDFTDGPLDDWKGYIEKADDGKWYSASHSYDRSGYNVYEYEGKADTGIELITFDPVQTSFFQIQFSNFVVTESGFALKEGVTWQNGGAVTINVTIENGRMVCVVMEDGLGTYTIRITKFGTTEVEVPADIAAEIEKYRAEHAE